MNDCYHGGATADERWKNDILQEMRKIRELLEQGQSVDIKEAPKRRTRKAVASSDTG